MQSVTEAAGLAPYGQTTSGVEFLILCLFSVMTVPIKKIQCTFALFGTFDFEDYFSIIVRSSLLHHPYHNLSIELKK